MKQSSAIVSKYLDVSMWEVWLWFAYVSLLEVMFMIRSSPSVSVRTIFKHAYSVSDIRIRKAPAKNARAALTAKLALRVGTKTTATRSSTSRIPRRCCLTYMSLLVSFVRSRSGDVETIHQTLERGWCALQANSGSHVCSSCVAGVVACLHPMQRSWGQNSYARYSDLLTHLPFRHVVNLLR